MESKFTADEMTQFLAEVFPQMQNEFVVEHLDGENVTMRMPVFDRHLRPGGTVSGPTMFALADVAAYVATMAPIGREALAVTTGCSLDFMRKPVADVPLVAHAKLLKLGKQLSVSDVMIYSEGMDKPVARATLTYAIPPKSMG